MFNAVVQTWDGIPVASFRSIKPCMLEAKQAIKDAFNLPVVSSNAVHYQGLLAYCFCTSFNLSDVYVVYQKIGA